MQSAPTAIPQKKPAMNALNRLDRLEDFMPDFFRRLSRPLALTEYPGNIRIDVAENDGTTAVSWCGKNVNGSASRGFSPGRR